MDTQHTLQSGDTYEIISYSLSTNDVEIEFINPFDTSPVRINFRLDELAHMISNIEQVMKLPKTD